jgi:dihydroflavonol-4-reductase
VHHLVARGDPVRVLKRRRTPLDILKGLPVEFVEGDVTDPESLRRASQGVEGVYHVAGLVSYWRPRRAWQHRVNVEGTRNVVEAALASGVRRLVHTSSIAAIGYSTDGRPCDEETEWNWGPQDIHYARTKHLGEQEAWQAAARGLEVVVVNPGLIFGPRDTGWNAGRMFKLVEKRRTVFSPAGSTTTCDADDVCAGHLAAMERGQPGRRYILGGENVAYAELFRLVGEVMGKAVRVKMIPYWAAQTVAAVNYWKSLLTRREPALTPELLRLGRFARHYSSARAIRELGYPQTPLRATLEKTYRWYVENGYLESRR